MKYDNEEQNYKVIITQVEGKTLKNIGKIKIKNKNKYYYNIYELYVDNDILMAVGTREDERSYMRGYDVYGYSYKTETVIFSYDISNRKKPILVSENIQEGEYVSSRLSGGYLYTISEKNMGIITREYCVPQINGEPILAEDIYLPEIIEDRKYTVITALDLHNAEEYTKTVSVAGGTSNIYVSNEDIYLIESSMEEEDISNTKDGKKALEKNKEYSFYYDNEEYSVDNVTKNNIKKMYSEVEDVTAIADTSIYKVTDSINIVKYAYNEGKIEFVAEQTIDGYAEDNMLFDEKDGYLRFVTTEESYVSITTKIYYYDQDNELIYNNDIEEMHVESFEETNNLFVLDEQLNVKAEINGLAEGESVYSARYLGDYGYFVTYENTDPLFSVDFSDIENPKIIGELKMPGYSQYLHFYTEDKLFGLGMETDENSGEELGLKLEMYNVTGGNAKTNTKLVLEDIDYSSALDNYKALMIDSSKNLIGFVGENYDTFNGYYYLYTYKKGEFSQLRKIKLGEYYWSDVRGFYINDYFYIVIPEEKIIVLSLENYKKVGGIKLN